jgi:integrase
MKARRTHTVPLSDRTLAILDAVPTEGDFIFPGAIAGRGLGRLVMGRVLKDLGHSETIHGFRSVFKDWCAEATTYPNEMSEMALAHAVSNKVEAAYRRMDMREKRRALMQDWSAFCESGGRA